MSRSGRENRNPIQEIGKMTLWGKLKALGQETQGSQGTLTEHARVFPLRRRLKRKQRKPRTS